MKRTRYHHLFTLCAALALLAGLLLRVAPIVNARTTDSPDAQSATLTVTTTADSGAGSLRQAILDANTSPGADTITFSIGASGSQQTIAPLTNLPTISDPVMLDGWSQGGSGYNGPQSREDSSQLRFRSNYRKRSARRKQLGRSSNKTMY